MRRCLAVLTCSLLGSTLRSEEPIFPDGTPARLNGGLMIIRQGNQTTVSLGGVVLPRQVKVTTVTPEGPVVTRFTLPSMFQTPSGVVPLPDAAPALIRVEVPDVYALLYVDGEVVRTRGTVRYLQSPPLPPGTSYPLRLRAAFQVGDNLLIEDRQIVIGPGTSGVVTFDGSRALSVPLPRPVETLPPPRRAG
jgi:uncharacterized protein (TIGR03000 family)